MFDWDEKRKKTVIDFLYVVWVSIWFFALIVAGTVVSVIVPIGQ